MSFKESIQRTKLITESLDLSVLVWGPGSAGAEHFEKRKKIRDEISNCFRNADVRFSEDLSLADHLTGADPLSLPDQELWHLAACDVCVVLDTSKGAGEEIAHFVASQFAHKLLILTHEKNMSSASFPAKLRENRNQMFYDDLQYDSCSLVEHVLTRVRNVALGKMAGFRV